METRSLVPLDDTGVIPLQAKDAAALIIVHKVLDWMVETGDWTYSHAFKETGVSYWDFYRAYRRPAVQAMVADWLGELRIATAAMLRKRWLQVIGHMMDIAAGELGDERAAVHATRFLDGVRQGLEGQVQTGNTQGKSRAAELLERFKAQHQGTVSAKRTTVTEQLTFSDSREGIDGEPQ